MLGALAVATATYLASFTPYFLHGHGLADLAALHREMLAFHAQLPAQLGQSEPVYLWPWTLRGVTFLFEASGNDVQTVVCAGGRLLWWAIMPLAIVYARRGRHLRWLLPVAAIAATWLPWFAIGRFGMTYYLLPALPFAAILASHAASRMRAAPAIVAAITLAGFAITYPVMTAMPVSRATYGVLVR
jgi:dolichyl-phosphate-mannose--protein O-mannosyl transferase